MAEKKKNLSQHDPTTIKEVIGKKVAIVTAKWNETVTFSMQKACRETLLQHGFTPENILDYYVEGSFELPFLAKKIIERQRVDAVICIGCIIQGETRHFDFIAQTTANAIMEVGLSTGVPVAFGVLTTNNFQQAEDRAGGKHGNKGTEAAVACLQMLATLETL